MRPETITSYSQLLYKPEEEEEQIDERYLQRFSKGAGTIREQDVYSDRQSHHKGREEGITSGDKRGFLGERDRILSDYKH